MSSSHAHEQRDIAVEASEPVVRPSSIQLNLDTFDQATHEIVEQERQAQNKFAEFEPFAVTPYSGTPAPSGMHQNYDAGDPWARQESVEASYPEPAQDYYDSAYEPPPDLYRSRRRALTLLFVVGVVAVWAMAMLMQVGPDRLFKDPYGETLKVFTQSDADVGTSSQSAGPETQVIVKRAQVLAQIAEVKMIKGGVYLVRGAITNQGEESITAALLKVTMRNPSEGDTPWIQRFEFNCCQETAVEGLSKSEHRALMKSLRAGELNQEGIVNLSTQQRQSFTFLAGLHPAIKVSKSERPRVDIEVVFAE